MLVTKDDFINADIGLKHFNTAQDEGVSIVYIAVSKDGKTEKGPIELGLSYKYDIADYVNQIKLNKNKGRCLHYYCGDRCNEIISAHSIQKNQSLDSIAETGHVYTLSKDIGSLKRNQGKLKYVKRGVNQVSTFLGFCGRHDNELFEAIDDFVLSPTDQQVFLYAYRSLCRELFVKENTISLIGKQLNNNVSNTVRDFLRKFKKGTEFGLNNLKRHKTEYDNSLRNKLYQDIRYVLFITHEKPFIAFSGLLYPQYDFLGRQLQDLANHNENLDLITFCTAPADSGCGVLFSWHNSSSSSCVEFMKSLATMMHDKANLGDLIFRLIVSNCENLAFSPNWWESLSTNDREQVESSASSTANIFSSMNAKYLMEGLEGIVQWKFDGVISNME
jgi:hypothetical protein